MTRIAVKVRQDVGAIGFDGPVVEWRGPAPFFFVAVPSEYGPTLRAMAQQASYGWGCVPVTATIAAVDFGTSLFPKDGSYLVPLKGVVRRALDVAPGDTVRVMLRVADRADARDKSYPPRLER